VADTTPIYERLKRRRESLDVSLDQVAQRLGFHDITGLSRWERGFKKSIPHKKTPEDYKRVLDEFAREQKAAAR
jgi:transcriptional regulator with XRE-family HTH domain